MQTLISQIKLPLGPRQPKLLVPKIQGKENTSCKYNTSTQNTPSLVIPRTFDGGLSISVRTTATRLRGWRDKIIQIPNKKIPVTALRDLKAQRILVTTTKVPHPLPLTNQDALHGAYQWLTEDRDRHDSLGCGHWSRSENLNVDRGN